MVNPACLICGVVNLASLHPQKRLCLLHVIANQCLASAEAPLSSACHCEPVPCTRRSAAAFCMSLQNTPLQPHPRPRLLHVIANHALATAPTPPPSACHCEPVPCTRRSAAAFCMSLRTSAHTGVAIRVPWQKRGTLLPPPGAHTPTKSVIANQCAHWCGNPRPLAETWYTAAAPGCAHTYQVCHCEPVRTLVRQSASPQGYLANM